MEKSRLSKKSRPEKIKEKNKKYYYKNKANLSLEDIDLYGEYLPLVAKIYRNANKLKEVNPELLNIILRKCKET